MPKSVFDVLTDKIDEQISSAQSFVAGGSPKDYPAYRGVRKINHRRPLA